MITSEMYLLSFAGYFLQKLVRKVQKTGQRILQKVFEVKSTSVRECISHPDVVY